MVIFDQINENKGNPLLFNDFPLFFIDFDQNYQKIFYEKFSKYFFSMTKKYFCPDFFLVKRSRTVGIENGQTLDKTPPETGDTVPNGRCGRKKTLSGKI